MQRLGVIAMGTLWMLFPAAIVIATVKCHRQQQM